MSGKHLYQKTIIYHPRASLVPVFSFGENDVYEQVKNPRGSPLRQWQVKMKDLVGFAPPLFRGRGVFQYTFGFLPYRRPIYTVGEVTLQCPLCSFVAWHKSLFIYTNVGPILYQYEFLMNLYFKD